MVPRQDCCRGADPTERRGKGGGGHHAFEDLLYDCGISWQVASCHERWSLPRYKHSFQLRALQCMLVELQCPGLPVVMYASSSRGTRLKALLISPTRLTHD